MGPAGQAAIPPNVCADRLPAALNAFPSPASPSESLETPSLSQTLASTYAPPQWTPRSLLPEVAAALPTQPGDVSFEPILTPPLIGDMPEPDMNTIVGGALAPVHLTPPIPPQQKSDHGLRLPSFEALGIAAPHPDRFGSPSLDGALADPLRDTMRVCPRGDADLYDAFSRLGGGGQLDPVIDGKASGGRAIQSPVHQYVNVLTPPADSGDSLWKSMATLSSGTMDSPGTDLGDMAPPAASAQANPGASATPTEPLISVQPNIIDDGHGWVEGAVQALRKSTVAAASEQ